MRHGKNLNGLNMKLKRGSFLQGGKYKIEAVLGQGSFGITYLATAKFSTDGGLGKMEVVAKVAIKEFFMSDVNSRSADGCTVEGSSGSVFTNYRKKFKKEAENLLKLDHPGIVKVQDVFDENNTTYYSMEYVDGGNLDDYISNNTPIDESEAVRIVRSICDALAFMHDKKMLHLDLKPKNIMRSSKGEIYLIDFGLSKQFTENGEPESSTTIGQGTPGYAPLEQANLIKDGTFPATLDIYALGATMYKILTGNRPLDASDILNDGFPKDLLLHYGRSDTLIGIVEKSMSPMKKDRFQKISDIVGLLPRIDIKIHIENEDNKQIDTVQNEGTVIDKPKKKKITQSKVDDDKTADGSSLERKFVNFPIVPRSVNIHLLGKDNNWCQLWITPQYIKGEYDRHFKSIGTKKIEEDRFYDIVTELDSIISRYKIQKSKYNSRNIDIWYGDKTPPDYYLLDDDSLAEFCRILPYNKQFRIHRFINENALDIYNSVSLEDEAEYTTQSRFRTFLNKFSESGTVWHDLKLTIGLVGVGVGIMFVLMNGFAGKDSKKNTSTSAPNQSDYHQYYQTHSAEIDSLTTKVALEVLEKQSK